MFNKLKKKLVVNSGPAEQKMVQCTTVVDKDAITRTTIDGVEHIVISSKTLPDNIVMNGGLYPASEIAKSFESLERTLAPIGHPVDSDGNYVLANDPIAIHNFHGGAFNANVRREDGRVLMDKVVNVQEAMKSERGLRLLDRIKELETNSDPRPIHTSVTALVEIERLSSPRANAAGANYTWIARNMVFDHDAILLDSVGAAQPHQGVGMAVNGKGEKIKTVQYELPVLNPNEDLSHSEIRESLDQAIRTAPLNGDWVVDVFEDTVIFMIGDQYFSAPYVLDGVIAKIVGIPLPVDRDVTYVPKSNEEGEVMKSIIVNALKKAGIEVDGLTDDQLMAQYDVLKANQIADEAATAAAAKATADAAAAAGGAGPEAKALADVVANALKPIADQMKSLEAQLAAKDNKELDEVAAIVGNSDKYPGIDAETAKKLGLETLKTMAANCGQAFGIPLIAPNAEQAEQNKPLDMQA